MLSMNALQMPPSAILVRRWDTISLCVMQAVHGIEEEEEGFFDE